MALRVRKQAFFRYSSGNEKLCIESEKINLGDLRESHLVYLGFLFRTEIMADLCFGE